MQQKHSINCTWLCRPRIALSIVASLALTASNGFVGRTISGRRGTLSNPSSTSRTRNKKERPRAWDSNSTSESNHRISAWRSVQSSCSSHLQNISTSGSNCVQVATIPCREGTGSSACLRHTSCPVVGRKKVGALKSSQHVTLRARQHQLRTNPHETQ